MIIATRNLGIRRSDSLYTAQIRIFAPEQEDGAWVCRYEIDWPENTRASCSAGLDSVQALWLVLQKIGTDVYMSKYHASGDLIWLDENDGYGFPVPKNGRDFLIGSDKVLEG